MGIVAHCPNGHRIKVKDEFAGKKVLCPHCQAQFRVAAAKSLPIARIVPLDPAVVATLPRALPWDATPSPKPAAPEPAALAAGQSWHPLIAEQPLATWSIVQPGGEPSAPLAAEAMQRWLESRQATGGELVWRSDWPAWLPIADAFPAYMPAARV